MLFYFTTRKFFDLLITVDLCCNERILSNVISVLFVAQPPGFQCSTLSEPSALAFKPPFGRIRASFSSMDLNVGFAYHHAQAPAG